jgi:hypothetical protein
MKEALEHEKTKNIDRVSGYDTFKLNRSKHRIIEHTIQNKDGSQECITYFKSIDPVNILSEFSYTKKTLSILEISIPSSLGINTHQP